MKTTSQSNYMMRINICILAFLIFLHSSSVCGFRGANKVAKRVQSLRNINIPTDSSVSAREAIKLFEDELKSLQGTPELVDRLENLALRYRGIELEIDLYRAIYPFKLDEFQERGLLSLISGKNVLVSTPTGSGKTIIGELAIYFALMIGLKVIYTTPLKALSNQKFQDFTRSFGGDRVGLLTGDIAINRNAKIIIMTTEVFRSMVYDESSEDQLENLFVVCFDEFHFMNDPDRGTVWEESVISCPPSVRILALSATMGNVAEIKGWMSSIHGETDLVLSDHRPVPLRYLFCMKQGLFPLFRDPNAGPGSPAGIKREEGGKLDAGSSLNPAIVKVEEQTLQKAQMKFLQQGRSRHGAPSRSARPNAAAVSVPRYDDLVDELRSLNLLPAIVFIFSRSGCEQCAKMVAQAKRKLLSDEDVAYVTQAITTFVKEHPEIPVQKSSVQMLRAGVGVHHAGLIPVWKALIEDLFNANKVKILFATETLAAGVNMPARTTVISTVTKRVNSEVIKLRTSQLLQMAGRAGRRGKDIEGTVVFLRNRFEDAKMGHKIITSPVDGIRSHFKVSYGLAVKLLESRTIDECRALVERGFGAYLLQKKVVKKEGGKQAEIQSFQRVLQKYTLPGARDFFKLVRRLEKERRNTQFLEEKMVESDRDLVQAIADYMPLGVGIKLWDGENGFFLGDVKWGDNNKKNGLGMITRGKRVLVVQKEHIQAFADPADSIPVTDASTLVELISAAESWEEMVLQGSKRPLLLAHHSAGSAESVWSEDASRMAAALKAVEMAQPFPVVAVPGALIRQRAIVQELEEELQRSPIAQAGAEEEELVLRALRHAVALKDPAAFVNAVVDTKGNAEGSKDVFAWRMFLNVLKVLQAFNAMNGTNATELGKMVSSLSGDNELWLALIIERPSLAELSPAELAGVLSASVIDGRKGTNSFFAKKPSEKVVEVFAELEPISWQLKSYQSDLGIDFPVFITPEAAGLVESWVSGVSWRELCKDTSLDQGDVCRMLRRTVEALRQVTLAYGVPTSVARAAYEAAERMDRFPVADIADRSAVLGDEKGTGRGAGVGFAPRADHLINGDDTNVVAVDTVDAPERDENLSAWADMFEDDTELDFVEEEEEDLLFDENRREEKNDIAGDASEGRTTSYDMDLDDLLSRIGGGDGNVARALDSVSTLDVVWEGDTDNFATENIDGVLVSDDDDPTLVQNVDEIPVDEDKELME